MMRILEAFMEFENEVSCRDKDLYDFKQRLLLPDLRD